MHSRDIGIAHGKLACNAREEVIIVIDAIEARDVEYGHCYDGRVANSQECIGLATAAQQDISIQERSLGFEVDRNRPRTVGRHDSLDRREEAALQGFGIEEDRHLLAVGGQGRPLLIRPTNIDVRLRADDERQGVEAVQDEPIEPMPQGVEVEEVDTIGIGDYLAIDGVGCGDGDEAHGS